MAALGLFTRADRATFAAYCQAWSDWIQLTDTLNKMGDVTYTTANGYVGITPLIHTRQKAWQGVSQHSETGGGWWRLCNIASPSGP